MSDRILVVDDEPFVCQLLSEKLKKEGYSVTTAPSGQRAIEEIDRTEFSLVLTDIRMEGMDGIELTRQIKRGTLIGCVNRKRRCILSV